MFGSAWEVLAPYQGVFWFFVMVVMLLVVAVGVAGYYLLWKDFGHDD